MKRITQNLRWLVTLLAMIVCTGAWAQDVTYDFTGSDWTVSNGVLSNGTVSFTGEGSANFKMNTGYFMLGQTGAYINFPTYNFDVERIEVVGRSGASGSVKQNIFVNDVAVSTETTGATGTNSYEIASDYQAAGKQYTLKVTSKHNTQITAIKIYKKVNANLVSIAVSGNYPTIFYVGDTFNHSGAVITATFSDNSTQDVTESATFTTPDMSTAGTKTVSVSYTRNNVTVETSYNITVKTYTVEDGVFDFTGSYDYNSGVQPTSESSYYVEEAKTWTAGNVTLVTEGKYRWWYNANGNTLRLYDQSSITLSVPDGYVITKVVLTGTDLNALTSDDSGYTANTWEGESKTVILTKTGDKKPYIETITVTYTQAAAPLPYTLTLAGNNNATINAFYYNDVNVYTTINNSDEVLSGTKVFIAVDANDGYEAKSVTVTDANNGDVTVTKEPVYDESIDPVWSFIMPASDVTVSCTVSVPAEEFKFVKVTSTDDLFVGGEYIIVNEESSKAMSTTQNSNNRGAAEIFLSDGTATIGEDTQIFTLEGNSDGWYFNTGNGYIYASSKSSNQLRTKSEKDDDAKAVISIDNYGDATITFQREGRNTLMFNKTNNSQIFSCYASDATMQPVQLYKKVGQNPITIDENTTLAAGKYATRIYPFAPSIPGITFYSCNAVNGTSLTLTPVTNPQACVPYILGNDAEGATEAISLEQIGVDKHEADTYEAGLLIGAFVNTEITSGYVLQTQNEKQSFYKVGTENPITVPPYRAYLNYSASVKSIGFDATTAINTLEVLTSGAYEGIYTVDGVKLNRLEKGVNILKMADGTTRKVVVK